jgi:hypothetical protein
LIERKNTNKTVKCQLKRKVGTDGMPGGSDQSKKKVFKKRCANHDVWELMNAGEFKWKDD